jgi:hypothetical protein
LALTGVYQVIAIHAATGGWIALCSDGLWLVRLVALTLMALAERSEQQSLGKFGVVPAVGLRID